MLNKGQRHTKSIQIFLYRYEICIRPQEGYCCVGYSLCPDAASWQLDQSNVKAMTVCSADYIEIEGKSKFLNIFHLKHFLDIFQVPQLFANKWLEIQSFKVDFAPKSSIW